MLLLIILQGCSDTIKISKGGDFTISAEPYRTTISKGETRDISIAIYTESTYKETVYNIRYYQTEGEGMVQMDDGRIMRENNEYLLSEKEFTISYTSASDTSHSFTIIVSDNLAHSQKMIIELANR